MDTKYWNDYYKKNVLTTEPSLFSKEIVKRIGNQSGKKLIDLGCGNGRDSVFFNEQGLCVTAIDSAESTIEALKKENGDKIIFLCGDFTKKENLLEENYDYVYSRFTIHAITEDNQKELLKNVYDALRPKGEFFIEVRSINDEIFGKGEKRSDREYIYEGHYRRFIKKSELVQQLQQVGFTILSEEEKRGFAPFGNQDPMVIRIVAAK